MESHVLGVIAVVLSFIYLVMYLATKRSTVPGPYGLPLLGYLPFLGKTPYVTFAKLASKYGPVFGMSLGTRECVVLNSFEAIKDSLIRQSEVFAGRPDDFVLKILENETAFIFQDGKEWKESRMFCNSSLKQVGFGRQGLEPIIQSEMTAFLQELEKQQSSSGITPISSVLNLSVGNGYSSILIGYRLDYDDPFLIDLEETIMRLAVTYLNDVKFFFPWIRKVPFLAKLFEVKGQKSIKKHFLELLQTKITEAEEQEKRDEKPCLSFISLWLDEQAKRKEANQAYDLFSDVHLLSNLDILCQASFETTAVTIQWALIYLVSDPLIQERLHKEIDDIIGPDKTPAYSYAKLMPYTRAFIQETHRKASIVPGSVFHSNTEEASVLGVKIKKRTTIIPNLWAVHHDPKVFPNPQKVDPNRFLDENGQFLKHESVIPFSAGRRHCPGAEVSQMVIFLYLSSLLQKFHLEIPEGQEFNAISRATLVTTPAPFGLRLRKI